MSDSILTSTKKILGIDEDYEVFDLDILTHINSVFATLNQLGIGPDDGYQIADKADTWDLFQDDPRYNSIKTYVYLKVRLLFDPPSTSFAIASLNEQVKELEWRLNTYREFTTITENPFVLDGGDAGGG